MVFPLFFHLPISTNSKVLLPIFCAIFSFDLWNRSTQSDSNDSRMRRQWISLIEKHHRTHPQKLFRSRNQFFFIAVFNTKMNIRELKNINLLSESRKVENRFVRLCLNFFSLQCWKLAKMCWSDWKTIEFFSEERIKNVCAVQTWNIAS